MTAELMAEDVEFGHKALELMSPSELFVIVDEEYAKFERGSSSG